MNRTHLIVTAAALALAACGGGEKEAEGNAAADASAAQSSEASADSSAAEKPAAAGATSAEGGNLIQPGEWETRVEAVEVDAPGMPQQVKDMMAGAMGNTKKTIRDCVTPEEAKRPKADLFAGKDKGNCTSTDFSMSGGRLRGTISCPASAGQPGSVKLAMDGEFNPQSYTVNQTMTTDVAGNKMTIKARVTGRRVGECSAQAAGG